MRINSTLLLLFVLPLLTAGLVAQKSYSEFMQKYNSARELSDPKALAKAFKKYPTEAIWHFEDRCDAMIQANDLKAAAEVDEIKVGFKKAWGSGVLDHIERFRRGLDNRTIARINKIRSQENVAWKLFEEAKKTMKESDFRKAIDGMQKVAEAMDETGAKLKAARSWLMLANIIERFPQKTHDDMSLANQAIQSYLQNHQDWTWTKTSQYAQNVAWAKGLKARLEQPAGKAGKKGADGKNGAAGAGAEAGGLVKYKPGSKWETVPLTYKVQKRSVEGISLYACSWPLNWLGFFMDGTAPVQMKFFADGKIYVRRAGAAKFTNPLSTDPQGIKAAKAIKLGGTKKPTDLWYNRTDEDGETYETNYAFFIYTGSNQEAFANVTLNFAPQWSNKKKTASLQVKSAAYFTTSIAGSQVTLFDENCNGVFGDKPGARAYNTFRFGNGLDKPSRHEIFDSMRIGKGKLVPFSPMVHIGEEWYLLKVIRNNEKLRYRALAEVPTGTIKVAWKGSKAAKPKHLCIKEVSGKWSNAMFDLMAGGSKGITVPAGKYEVFYGRTYNGKVPRNADAVILKGDSKSIELAEGKTVTLGLGAPFHIDFKFERSRGKVTATSTKMWVRDRFGLRYTALASEMLEPELVVAKDKKGKGSKVLGSWRRIAGNELNSLTKQHEGKSALTLAAYAIDKKSGGKPRFSITAKNPYDGGDFVVGLRQKKHRLFGKLTPLWK